MAKSYVETKTLQCWPGGASYTFKGDPDGPADQRRLKDAYKSGARWRKGTAKEWRAIRVELRAEIYQRNEVLACQSGLVDDLLKLDRAVDGVSFEDIENARTNPEDWTVDACREWLDERGIALDRLDDDDEDGFRDLVRDNAEDAEIYEWWLVSDWLCKQLKAIGEPVIDAGFGMQWWGRTCTGQGFIMDGTLQTIAASFETEEN